MEASAVVLSRQNVHAERERRLTATATGRRKKILWAVRDVHVVRNQQAILAGVLKFCKLIMPFLDMAARRPAQECTCERASQENTVSGATCECGKRPADACTCEKNSAYGPREGEIDFTTKR
ncbi:hypothetical protein FN846DRAFT_980567 [Sphaerosporella brunnea]|uniref:DUF7871 domain-containing protein n=1 Tax=Sphaerosporella brunnea TaxID=1250544 RepID=A0A5J5ECG4_9PEZI|nr:hypothetical protein FN846DRAFT_980567 [Sphaerosporella brunnea]